MELLGDLGAAGYEQGIGPGVWDIHSPRVPSLDEMTGALSLALRSVDAGRLWVNPDCGLKTRGYPETEAALRTMVAAARQVRELVQAG
jgi:5-methyltetrahydropteroyltriglutamate--homocysteine methyltransferase